MKRSFAAFLTFLVALTFACSLLPGFGEPTPTARKSKPTLTKVKRTFTRTVKKTTQKTVRASKSPVPTVKGQIASITPLPGPTEEIGIEVTKTAKSTVEEEPTEESTEEFTEEPTSENPEEETRTPTRTIVMVIKTGTSTRTLSTRVIKSTGTSTLTLARTLTETRTPTITMTPTETLIPTSTRTPTETDVSDAPCALTYNPEFEDELFLLINDERASKSSTPQLVRNELLDLAAKRHTIDMICEDFYSDVGSDGSTLYDRLNKAGYSFSKAVQNIFAGAGEKNNASTAFTTWLSLPTSKAHLINSSLTEIGISYATDPNSTYEGYFTAVFARPTD